MNSKIFRTGVLCGLFSFSMAASAKNPNPWTDCGIGALIFSEVEGAGKALAAISNIIWDLGTTGSSSSSSSPGTCAGADVTAALFIQENIEIMEEQLAMGSGSHLTTVMEIYGCEGSAQPAISTDLRQGFKATSADESYWNGNKAEKAEAIWLQVSDVVSSHAEECSA